MDPNPLFFAGFEEVFKLAILFAEGVYVFLAFIMTRQVKLMNNSFCTPTGSVFLLLARMHLILSAGILFLSILLLL